MNATERGTYLEFSDFTPDQLEKFVAKIKEWTKSDEDFLTNPNQRFCLLKHLRYTYCINIIAASAFIDFYFPEVKP